MDKTQIPEGFDDGREDEKTAKMLEILLTEITDEKITGFTTEIELKLRKDREKRQKLMTEYKNILK